MRLLITTQAVDKNDPALGFFHDWLKEFANVCEQVTVICLRKGDYDLPENVAVYSLGKERRLGKFRYLLNFYRYIFTLRNRYDAVLVHMNPEYVVLGGAWWRLTGKTIALWYVHRAVNLKLRIAAALAHLIFSASPEGFRITTPKARFIGHGIEVERFAVTREVPRVGDPTRIVSVGRITPIKHCETLITAAAILSKRGMALRVTFIGEPTQAGDDEYRERLRAQIVEAGISDTVTFAGGVSYGQMPAVYQQADMAINMVPTGGYDKTVIEAMAAGVPVITSNEGYRQHLAPYADALIFRHTDANDLAEKIAALAARHDRDEVIRQLRENARARFTITGIVRCIVDELTHLSNVRG